MEEILAVEEGQPKTDIQQHIEYIVTNGRGYDPPRFSEIEEFGSPKHQYSFALFHLEQNKHSPSAYWKPQDFYKEVNKDINEKMERVSLRMYLNDNLDKFLKRFGLRTRNKTDPKKDN